MVRTNKEGLNLGEIPKVKVGVVGCGKIASSRILPSLKYLPVDLEAVCDLDEEKAHDNARRFGAETIYKDYHMMLEKGGFDAVIIAVGPEDHWKMSIEAMRAGFHVYTEKPPSITANQAKEVLMVSRKTGKICMTAFKKRFAPVYKKAKEIMVDSDFGSPILLSIDRHDRHVTNDPKKPGSMFLLDVAIHVIDLARYLFGEPAEVFSWKKQESCYAVSIKFKSGALGTLSLSCHRSEKLPSETVEITGAPGRFITIRNSIEMVHYRDSKVGSWHWPNFATAAGDSLIETGFVGELEEFVKSIREQRQPESNIESSYLTMRLYEAIRYSNGNIIRL